MNIINTLNKAQSKLLKIHCYKKDRIIFHQGDKCTEIGIIITGEVSIVSYLIDGSEIVYNSLKQDEIFGNNLIFSTSPYHKGNIIANKDCQIAYIKKSDLLKILQNNESFLLEYLKLQSDFTKKLNDNIKLLSIPSAEERFYYYMNTHSNIVEYDSISRLCKNIYLKRETLSRLLSKLVKNGVVKRESNYIMLVNHKEK